MKPIKRILNKAHNIAIPHEICRELGLKKGDLLSYSITESGDVLIHKEQDAPADTIRIEKADDPIVRMLGDLTPEQQCAAITYLSIRCKESMEKKIKNT